MQEKKYYWVRTKNGYDIALKKGDDWFMCGDEEKLNHLIKEVLVEVIEYPHNKKEGETKKFSSQNGLDIQYNELWDDIKKQRGLVFPPLLERFMLMEFYLMDFSEEMDKIDLMHDLNYIKLLIADCVTVFADQESRLRKLEQK